MMDNARRMENINTGHWTGRRVCFEGERAVSLPKVCREYRLRRFPREGAHSELSKGHRLDGKVWVIEVEPADIKIATVGNHKEHVAELMVECFTCSSTPISRLG